MLKATLADKIRHPMPNNKSSNHISIGLLRKAYAGARDAHLMIQNSIKMKMVLRINFCYPWR